MTKGLMRELAEILVSDWRRKGSSGGLGHGFSYIGSPPSFKSTDEYDPSIMSFTLSTYAAGRHWHIDCIAQDLALIDVQKQS